MRVLIAHDGSKCADSAPDDLTQFRQPGGESVSVL